MIKLHPLTEGKPIGKFAVCDIEANSWINHIVTGYFDGEKFSHFKTHRQFLLWLFNLRADLRPTTLFAHFGGKYDFLFSLNELVEMYGFSITNCIPRGSSLLCFDVNHNGVTIAFKDSSAFLPFSLDKATKAFGASHKKKKIDYDKITKITPELLEYLEYDCRGLYETIENYCENELIQRAGFRATTAAQALSIFRTFISEPISGIYGHADSYIRKGYFGGRTEIFKPLHDGPGYLNAYDINSLYPSVLADQKNDFPGGIKGLTDKLDFNELGFFWVKCHVPEQYMPPLPYLHEGKLLFPCGYLEGIWSVAELKNAVEHYGVTIIKVKSGYLCHNIGNPFSDFISEMYQRRLDAKKAGDMVTDTIAKLTMNSLYGRFGLRKDRENIAFDLNQTGFQGKWNIEKNGKKIRLGTVPVELTTSFSNIAIAAYTTSYARIVNLNTAAPIAEKHLYYTDTDSFHVNTKMREGKGLGQLKLEYKAKQACFLLPKTYIVKTEDKDFAITLETDDPDSPTKSDKKVVMKGFNSRKIWRAFDIENFKMALDGNLKSLRIENEPKFATFKRALQKGKVLALLDAESRKINSKYTKRVIFKNNKGEYDTRPLLVTKTGDVK